MATGILCQACGIEAPTKKIEYHQNIGMLVMRKHRQIRGTLCKQCVHKYFWKMTGTTLFLGPWGYISLVISPFFILNNVVRYIGALGMPSVPPGASVPRLNDDIIGRLQPYTDEIFHRLNLNEPLANVATDIAGVVSVTPGQVLKYVYAVAEQSRRAAGPPQPRTGGFPVQPVAAIPVQPIGNGAM